MPPRYNVLYVDDEPDLLDITKLYLEKDGHFSVDCAFSGSEAVTRIAATCYDAVISDYQMPGMDGITLLKKVREIYKTLPFILFTGRGREEVVIEAINSGVDFYIQKGGEPKAQYAELSHKIRTAIERRTSERSFKESENRYRSLVENMHDCVAVYKAVADGEDFLILEFNHAAEKTEQVTREGVIGRKVTEVFPGVQEFGILDVFRRVWRTGIPESFPVSFYKDNRISGWRDNFIFKLPSGEIVASYSDETARKRAETALVESEEKYRLTLDATNDGIWDWNIPNGTTFFSHRWYTMIGYDPGELPAEYATWRSLLHPDDAGPAEQKIQNHIGRKDDLYSAEFRMRTKQGDWKWILARGKVVERDSGGNAIRMVGTHTDIDERRRAEESLQESRERYRAVADFTYDWEFWMAPDGKFIYVSPSCERITGYRPEEFILDPNLLFTIAHADDRARIIDHVSLEKTRYGEHGTLEFRIIAKNGGVRWIGHECQPVYSTSNEFLGNRASNRDITGRKEAEQQIAESSRFLATLIDTLPIPVFYKGADGKYLGCNPPFEEYIGIRRNELIGKTVYDIAPKELADMYLAADQEIIDNPAPQQYETQVMFADGSRHEVIFYKAPFYNNDGSVGGLIGAFIDITERKLIELELERKNQELMASYEQLTASEEELRHTFDELSRSEQALRKSEEHVRQKLESLLSPGGDIGTVELGDIIDAQELQSMMEDFYAITHMGIGIIDIRGNVLVGTGWQDICTKFHRVNPETCVNCLESDTLLTQGVEPGTFRKYKCKNNIWDIVTPIIVGGKHVGNIFLGQFLYDDESLDIGLFRAQAARYGFDEQAYLAALEQVPRWSREKVDILMAFYAKFARIISTLSYRNLLLARTVTERDTLLHSLQESELRHRRLYESSRDAIMTLEPPDWRFTSGNPSTVEMFRAKDEEGFTSASPWELSPEFQPDGRASGEKAKEMIETAVREGSNYFEWTHRRLTGEDFPATVLLTRFEWKGKQILQATVRDITEQKRAGDKISASLNEKVLLLREIHHRVKNNLQIIISLTNLQMRLTGDPGVKQVLAETQGRVRAMAFVHEKLYQSGDISRVELGSYTRYLVTQLFMSYGVDSRQVALDIDIGRIILDIETAIPLGLIINELASNALKHAFPDGRKGTLSITVREEGKILSLTIKNDGVDIPAEIDWRHAESLGLRLAISLVEQLDGTIELDRSAGTTFIIVVKEKE